MSGRRDLKTDDKNFVAEIARTFHIEKAVQKASRIEKRNNTAINSIIGARKEDTKTANDNKGINPPTSSKRKLKRQGGGGSVWITFKGGFSAVPIISTESSSSVVDAAVSKLSNFRGSLSEKNLVEGVRHAQEYMVSAGDQAADAGLHYTGESSLHRKRASAVRGDAEGPIDCSEGDAYMKEQRAVAVEPLVKASRAPVGTFKTALLGGAAALFDGRHVVPSFSDKASRDAFEDALVARRSLLQGSSNAAVDTDEARAVLYFNLAQRDDSQVAGNIAGGNTMCIVRSKSSVNNSVTVDTNHAAHHHEKRHASRRKRSERGKKSTLLFRTKSRADAFVHNFMNNVIRKEMSGAMRIKDGYADPHALAASSTDAPTSSHNQPTSKAGKKGRR